jgi:hypothetical protein
MTMVPSKDIFTTPEFSENAPPNDDRINGVANLRVEAIIAITT